MTRLPFFNQKSIAGKKFSASKSKSESNFSKRNRFYIQSKIPNTRENPQFKVFKPKKGVLIQEKIKNSIEKKTRLKLPSWLRFTLNWKSFRQFNLQTARQVVLNLRFLIVKSKILSQFNIWLLYGILYTLALSFIYLSFFDTFFLVKNYEVIFTGNSYLSPAQIHQITKAFNQKKFLATIPNNQYWFLNDGNLTLLAKSEVPEVESVKIISRSFPNKVTLKINTQPILATLKITEKGQVKYWRISQEGRVITEDTAGLGEKLIEVDKSVLFSQNQATFQNYPLQKDLVQVNRIWMTDYIQKFLDKNQISVISRVFPSITDTDVIFVTSQNTRLLFDSDINSLPREILDARLNILINTTLIDDLNRNSLAYIDFRISSNKIFVCNRSALCNK